MREADSDAATGLLAEDHWGAVVTGAGVLLC